MSQLLKLGNASKGYVCLPIQGSGTFGLEATFSTLLNYKSKILILSNGVYGNRIINSKEFFKDLNNDLNYTTHHGRI